MSKVIVTGGSGFIGSHLVKALAARGDEVACLVRKTSDVAELQAMGVRLIQGDITDLPSLKAAIAGQEVDISWPGAYEPATSSNFST